MVTDVITETQKQDDMNIYISETVHEAMDKLRDFLFKNVYEVETVRSEFRKCSKILESLFYYYLEHPDVFEKDSGGMREGDPLEQRVCDFIAGMTDRYAFYRYEQIFMPKPWEIF
jgi:dGTPase